MKTLNELSKITFDLTSDVYTITSEWEEAGGGTDTDGTTEPVEFYITLVQLARYFSDSFNTLSSQQQQSYLQGLYDAFLNECFDSLFDDEDFQDYMYEQYGHTQTR
jgi:hypothetical protein